MLQSSVVEQVKISSVIDTENILFNSAGFTCADMLRQNGFRGRVILFTREGTLPYDRVSDQYQSNKSSIIFDI